MLRLNSRKGAGLAAAAVLILLCGCSEEVVEQTYGSVTLPYISDGTAAQSQQAAPNPIVSEAEVTVTASQTEAVTSVTVPTLPQTEITTTATMPPYTTVSSNAYTDPTSATQSETTFVSSEEESEATESSEPTAEAEQRNWVAVSSARKPVPMAALDELNALAEQFNGQSAFYLLNLDDGMEVRFNEDVYMFAASTIKLPYSYYIYTVFEENGGADELKEFEERFRRDGTGEIQKMEAGTFFTLGELVNYSIVCSDNIAYEMLYERFGWEGYNELLERWGFRKYVSKYTKYGSVSPRLLGRFWREIYTKRDAGGVWDEFYAAVLDTTYSPIKNTLGSKVEVANKTGWANGYYHESGIVFREHPYVIVVMTVCEGSKEDREYVGQLIRAADSFMEKYNVSGFDEEAFADDITQSDTEIT